MRAFHSMRNSIVGFLLLIATAASLNGTEFHWSGYDDPEASRGKRGWMFKAGYTQQSTTRFVELGLGRINIVSYLDQTGKRSFAAGAAAFTLGSDIGFGDSSMIYSAKMGFEAHLTILGARITYGYYLQDKNASGVIGIEGGVCIFSVVYAYAGYNFVKGNQDYPVLQEGAKLSLGVNIPFGMRTTEPIRRIGS